MTTEPDMMERVARAIDPAAFELGAGSGHGPGECDDCDYHRDEARRSARAAIKAIEPLVERAFKDGLTYGNNVGGADPDIAWLHSRVRTSLKEGEGEAR